MLKKSVGGKFACFLRGNTEANSNFNRRGLRHDTIFVPSAVRKARGEKEDVSICDSFIILIL